MIDYTSLSRSDWLALSDRFYARLDSSIATLKPRDWERITPYLGWRPAWFFVGRVQVRTLFLVQFADNVFHERDLLIGTGRWPGIDPEWSRPLVDWAANIARG